MADSEVHFARAVAHARRLTPTLSEADQLRIYGLYKQATAGKCPEWPTTTPAAAAEGTVARKWAAWRDCAALTHEQAVLMYVSTVMELDREFVPTEPTPPDASPAAEAGADTTRPRATGVLYKQRGRGVLQHGGQVWRRRHFELDGSMLLYSSESGGDDENDAEADLAPPASLRKSLFLVGVRVRPIDAPATQGGRTLYPFVLTHPAASDGTTPSFTLAAASAADAQKWVAALRAATRPGPPAPPLPTPSMTREAASDAWSADDALLPLEPSAASALESALGPEMSATVEERLVALVRLARSDAGWQPWTRSKPPDSEDALAAGPFATFRRPPLGFAHAAAPGAFCIKGSGAVPFPPLIVARWCADAGSRAQFDPALAVEPSRSNVNEHDEGSCRAWREQWRLRVPWPAPPRALSLLAHWRATRDGGVAILYFSPPPLAAVDASPTARAGEAATAPAAELAFAGWYLRPLRDGAATHVTRVVSLDLCFEQLREQLRDAHAPIIEHIAEMHAHAVEQLGVAMLEATPPPSLPVALRKTRTSTSQALSDALLSEHVFGALAAEPGRAQRTVGNGTAAVPSGNASADNKTGAPSAEGPVAPSTIAAKPRQAASLSAGGDDAVPAVVPTSAQDAPRASTTSAKETGSTSARARTAPPAAPSVRDTVYGPNTRARALALREHFGVKQLLPLLVPSIAFARGGAYRGLLAALAMLWLIRSTLRTWLGEPAPLIVGGAADWGAGCSFFCSAGPYVGARSASCAVLRFHVELKRLLRYLEAKRAETGVELTATHVVIKAVAIALRRDRERARGRPSMVGRIVLGRFFPTRSIDVSHAFTVEGGVGNGADDEVILTKVEIADVKPIECIAAELRHAADEAAAGPGPADAMARASLRAALPAMLRPCAERVLGFVGGELGISLPRLGVRSHPSGAVLVVTPPGARESGSGTCAADMDIDLTGGATTGSGAPIVIVITGIRLQSGYTKEQRMTARPALHLAASIDLRAGSIARARRLFEDVAHLLSEPSQIDKLDREDQHLREERMMSPDL